MSKERAFIVEVDANDAPAAGAFSSTVSPGRYLVIQILQGHDSASNGVYAALLATSLDRDDRMVALKIGMVKFVGFRGDCLMCSHREPEAP